MERRLARLSVKGTGKANEARDARVAGGEPGARDAEGMVGMRGKAGRAMLKIFGGYRVRLSLVALLSAAALGISGRSAKGQEYGPEGVPLDRWLVTRPVTSVALGPEAADPLARTGGPPIMPDRDIVVGPGYWSLVRRAPPPAAGPGAWIDLVKDLVNPPAGGASPGGEGPVLAHTYLRAPTDRSLLLTLSHLSCRRLSGWLNGQPIADLARETSTPRDDGLIAAEHAEVRLGAGWNTLLVAVSEGDCPSRLGGWLRPSPLPSGRREEALDTKAVRVQASRPPGVRRSLPAGFLQVSSLGLDDELFWEAGAEDLSGSLIVPVTAWGRAVGEPSPPTASTERQRPSVPPAVDLSGRWDLQVFAPQGLTNATAELEMADDGSLTGEVRGTRLGGDLEDGWVSGRDFLFTIEARPGPSRLTYTGSSSATGDSIRGAIAFGQDGDLSFGFRGARVDVDGASREEEEPQEDAPAEPSAPDVGRGERRPGGGPPDGGPPGGLPGAETRQAIVRQQLLPPPEIRPPAPRKAELRMETGGDKQEATVSGLEPARTRELVILVSFDDLREASLSSTKVELRVQWEGGRRELARALAPGLLLTRLHRPIVLRGWSEVEGTPDDDAPSTRTLAGTWKIPDALSGFSLQLRADGEAGDFRLGGEPLGGEPLVLCAPCREGDRLELEVRAPREWEGTPTVVIVELGYPDAADNPSAPPAREWLEALRGGGNGRYRELSARFSEAGP